jgi:hypothetical protein
VDWALAWILVAGGTCIGVYGLIPVLIGRRRAAAAKAGLTIGRSPSYTWVGGWSITLGVLILIGLELKDRFFLVTVTWIAIVVSVVWNARLLYLRSKGKRIDRGNGSLNPRP